MVTHPTECLQKVLEQSDSKGSLSPLPAELCLLQMMGIGERGVQGSWNIVCGPLGGQVLQAEQCPFYHLNNTVSLRS